jgi:hypothetical protein
MPSRTRILFFHAEFWQGFLRLGIRHQASATALATVITFSPIALLTWALVTYGQGLAKDSSCKDPSTEKDRSRADGFIGNSDFYGLGIRLGIYLQWLASLIANPLLKSERASLAGSFLTFSLALPTAILILTFRRECTFTAEIMVVLNIFWGGTLLVMVPFVRFLADSKTTGLGLALIPLVLPMIPVSVWFWLRLGFYGEMDFLQTPGKTSRGATTFFLLAPVPADHLRGASVFMAVLCLILSVIPILSSICICLVVFLDCVGERPQEWRAEQEKGIGDRIRDLFARLIGRGTPPRPEPRYKKWYDCIPYWRGDELTLCRLIGVTGILIAGWSISAVELTLAWNSVEEVYSVSSTGQIIALVVGLGVLVKVLWVLRHGEGRDQTSGNGQRC